MRTTHYYNCRNVRVHDCEIASEVLDGVRGPSTDAIDIDRCRGFVVSNVYMNEVVAKPLLRAVCEPDHAA